MDDLITGTILLSILSGGFCYLGIYYVKEGNIGGAIVSFLLTLLFIGVAVAFIAPGYKKVPIVTTEKPQVDTLIVYRNGVKPDTTYTYKFNPDKRLE